MRHVKMVKASSNYQSELEDNKGIIHYEGVGLIGSHTLCGYTDLIGCEWSDTKKFVNCKGCIAIRDHVMGSTK